jgi:iron complex outermembrane recepter protein
MRDKLARARLGRAVSTWVLAVGCMAGNPAQGQDAAPPAHDAPQADAAAKDSEIVVTGTSIKGVAPIGSNLVSVGRADMMRLAPVNATEMTNTVPAISTAGSASVGENVYSYYSPQIHSLAGSASNTTLVLVDGMRMPGGGVQYAQTDPNIIPTSALQRVEVLADGASSVYGSDAVAGVVNYITRKTFSGFELSGKAGFADSWHSQDLNGILGKTWTGGGFYVAAQYSYQSPLANSSRSFLSMGDYRSVGGRNAQSFNCSPATIRTPSSGTSVYLSPGATSPVANTEANYSCNTSQYGDAIQSNARANILMRLSHTFDDRLETQLTLNYNHLLGSRGMGPGMINSANAFGPGAGAAGQSNPFYVAPAGDPGATQESITYAALRADNNYGRQVAENDTFYMYGFADYKFNDRISLKLSQALGHSRSSLNSYNVFCTSCAYLALNGTSLASGSTTASDIAGQNVVTLNTPLTTANALDVWHANGGATSTAVWNNLYSNNTSLTHTNDFYQVKLEGQARAFALPAGDVRLAAGGEFLSSSQKVDSVDPQNIVNTSLSSTFITYNLQRHSYSGYAEAVVPLIAEDMRVPLVRKLDIDVSVRHDQYNDVGGTTNPKIAANWQVARGIKLRGNYATSFVAPPLAAIGVPSMGYQRTATGATLSSTIYVPVALYPQVTQLPGCANATTLCAIGTGINQGLTRNYGVGPNAKPQTGNSWSIGLDLQPEFLPGFNVSLTYWANHFKGGVTRPDVSVQLYSQALHDRLVLCPAGCTTSQINSFTNVANGGTLTGSLPTQVYFLLNNDSGNLLNLNVQGLDFSATYRLPTQHAGTFNLGAQGTYYTKFMQDFGDTPFSVLNTSGFNSTFPSIQTRLRFQAGWQYGDFSIDGFANYTGGYWNWSNTALNPVTVNSAGLPNGGGDWVKSSTIFDLHAEYKLPVSFASNLAFYVDVKNLLNTAPPFFSGNTSGIGVGGYGYNGFVSNPIGRISSVGFRAAF